MRLRWKRINSKETNSFEFIESANEISYSLASIFAT